MSIFLIPDFPSPKLIGEYGHVCSDHPMFVLTLNLSNKCIHVGGPKSNISILDSLSMQEVKNFSDFCKVLILY